MLNEDIEILETLDNKTDYDMDKEILSALDAVDDDGKVINLDIFRQKSYMDQLRKCVKEDDGFFLDNNEAYEFYHYLKGVKERMEYMERSNNRKEERIDDLERELMEYDKAPEYNSVFSKTITEIFDDREVKQSMYAAIADRQAKEGIPLEEENNMEKEIKCTHCNGTGFVHIGPGIRGLKNCNACDGLGKRVIKFPTVYDSVKFEKFDDLEMTKVSIPADIMISNEDINDGINNVLGSGELLERLNKLVIADTNEKYIRELLNRLDKIIKYMNNFVNDTETGGIHADFVIDIAKGNDLSDWKRWINKEHFYFGDIEEGE